MKKAVGCWLLAVGKAHGPVLAELGGMAAVAVGVGAAVEWWAGVIAAGVAVVALVEWRA